MTGFIIALAVTFLLGLALVVVLVTTGRSPVSVRLMKVAGTVALPAEERGPGWRGRLGLLISGVTAPVRRALGFSANTKLVRSLSLAGYRDPEAVEIFYSAKMVAPVLGALIAGFIIRQDVFFWFVMISAVGFVLPDLWLTSAITRRRKRISLSLPDALDLLVICMEAGLGLDQALIRVGNELKISHPDLADEFLMVNLEQRTGKPRIDAWRSMAERTNLEVVRSFVHMLVQTERFGTPISRSLSVFADSLRTKRKQQAEQMAAKTTVKLVFPLVLFIFPSMFIVLLAPAVITISRSLGKFFQ
ncbi:MAG TPA: type II secretion system F family protein [Candidatus Angelobacter sp.]|nr:type II secretion system F family protein [Candidatus Angelobacter sp.]